MDLSQIRMTILASHTTGIYEAFEANLLKVKAYEFTTSLKDRTVMRKKLLKVLSL